jgi:serine/threonine-protein kinase
MADAPRSPGPADRNLLFGILALQMNFISRDALITGMQAWVLDKAKPIGQILAELGKLRPEHRAMLETLVDAHVRAHGNDPQKSLRALSSVSSVQDDLGQIADADVQATLVPLSQHELPTLPPSPPAAFGCRFRILRPYARGGLGEVFVANDEELNREVALKEIQAQYAGQSEHHARFLREGEITGGLEHPGIMPVYGMGTYPDGRPFYAMRFIHGDSLQEALRRFHSRDKPGRDAQERSLALRELLGRFVDVCKAIAYAHSRGVLHRDLKPGNVMLGKYGETLVVDWGLAKALGKGADNHTDGTGLASAGETPTSAITEAPTLMPKSHGGGNESNASAAPAADNAEVFPERPIVPRSTTAKEMATQMGQAIGTPAYMSPEQAAGRLDQLGPASDIYSLGATLYNLLTGQPPFQETDIGLLLTHVQLGEFPRPRAIKNAVPAALEAVCLRAMALHQSKRYGSAQELAAEVERWLADEPVEAYLEPPSARLGRWSRRHKALVAGAVALLMTAVASLSIGLVVVNHEQKRTQDALELAEDRRREAERERENVIRSEAEVQSQRKAVETHRAQLLTSLNSLAILLKTTGQYQKAEQTFRKSLIEQEKLVTQFPDVPDYRLQWAMGCSNLGNLLQDISDLPRAEEAYRQALTIQRKLASEHPDVSQYQQHLARILINLANLLVRVNKQTEAAESYLAGLELQKKLTQQFPNDPDLRKELARSYNNLGNLFLATNRFKEGEDAHRKALELKVALVRDFPKEPVNRLELGRSSIGFASALAANHHPEDAEKTYHGAVKVLKDLVADIPAVPEYRWELAYCYLKLGELLGDIGKSSEAETAFRQALPLYEKLSADSPTVADYRNEVATTLQRLADLLIARKELQGSQALLEQAVRHQEAAIRQNPKNPSYEQSMRNHLRTLEDVLLRLHNHEEVFKQVAGWPRQISMKSDDLVASATALASCMTLAASDSRLNASKREELMRKYAEKAMVDLDLAIQSGYTDLRRLKLEKSLDPLRGRLDFESFIARLEAKSKK